MEIRYYKTDLGLFTLIISSELYSQLNNASDSQNKVPWRDVVVTILKCEEASYSQDTLNAVSQIVNNLAVTPLVGVEANYDNMKYYYYDFAVDPVRQVIVDAYYRNNPAFLNVRSYGRGGFSYDANVTDFIYPYGFFKADSLYGTICNYVGCCVLVANDDFTAFKGASLYAVGTTIRYGVQQVRYDGAWTAFFANVEPIFVPSPDPYDEAGGGEGPLPGSQTIGLPDEPTVSPIDAGLFSLYSPTATQMRNLADFLWTDFGGTGTSVEQVLEEVVEALKRSVSNPLNSMLGLSIIASQGLSKGSDSSVHVGFWNTGVSMTKLTKQYFNVDCGSLSFSPVCGNTFLDYAPYSKFMIFLPYVGMRILDANDVVGHTISIKYRGDCVSGALTCYVIRDNSVIQEHTGNCALNIPLTADSWAETISGVAQLISGTVSGAAMGGTAAAAAAGAVKGAASIATNPSAFSPQVAHTGAVSGAAGHLGSQKPFILREAVRFHSTANFNSIIGYPSYHYRKLGDCHGYTQCLEVHLSHTPCTGAELQEIEELLKKGVII